MDDTQKAIGLKEQGKSLRQAATQLKVSKSIV